MNTRQASAELSFIISCTQYYLGLTDSSQVFHAARQVSNWEHIIQLSFYHRLVFILHHCSSKLPGLTPGTIQKRLSSLQKKNIAGMMKLSVELKKLKQLFDKHQKEFVAFKGPVLAQDIYGEPYFTRKSGDVDILVNQNELETVDRLLQQEGYSIIYDKEQRLSLSDKNYRAYQIKTNHHIQYVNQHNGVLVELHWRLTRNQEVDAFDLDEVDFLDEKIKTLSPDNQCMYLAWHGAGHKWNRLFWLVDLAKLSLRQDVNWELLIEKSKMQGIHRAFLSGFILAQKIFEVEIPQAIQEEYKTDAGKIDFLNRQAFKLHQINDRLFRSNVPKAQFYSLMIKTIAIEKSYGFYLKKPLKGKFAFISSLFHTPVNWHYIRLPEHLFFLYVFLRPFIIVALWFKRIKLKKNRTV